MMPLKKVRGAFAKLCLVILAFGTLIRLSGEGQSKPDLNMIGITTKNFVRGSSIENSMGRERLEQSNNLDAGVMDSENGEAATEQPTNIAPIEDKIRDKLVDEKGPLLFDRSNGWNGTSHDEGVEFCKNKAGSRSICPWKAYCQGGSHPFGGILRNNSETLSWAPIASEGQPVWVSIGSINPCMQRGDLGESLAKEKVQYILCCHEGEGEVMVNVGVETMNQTDLLIDDQGCRNECHLSNINTEVPVNLSSPQRYCLTRCRSMIHQTALSDVTNFFKALSTEADFLKTHANCTERCHGLTNKTPGSIIPSPSKRYCLARCRWMYRQKAVSRLTNSEVQKHDNNMTIISPTLSDGGCSDIANKLHYDGLCTSVAHRQKPRINLILSDQSWLGGEFNSGLRDCAASQCHVSSGQGHSNSSHLHVRTSSHPAQAKKVTANQINVMVQLESLKNISSGKTMQPGVNVDWLTSHRQDGFHPKSWVPYSRQLVMCDLCDKYAEEVLPNSQRSWDISLGVETLEKCMVDILSRHSIPDNLPLLNPALGFDAVFVTNYTPLKERKKAMTKRVRRQFGIDPLFISDFDREDLTDEIFKCVGNTEAQIAHIHDALIPGHYSLTLKHFAIYFYMIQQSLDNVLVLEDDASFANSDWISKESAWQDHLQRLPPDYDILFACGVEGTFNRGVRITKHLYFGQHSRAADMYMISQKGARNMLRSLPIVAVIDAHMNYAANHQGNKWLTQLQRFHGPRTVDIKFYHTEPPLSVQREPNGTRQTVSTYSI